MPQNPDTNPLNKSQEEQNFNDANEALKEFFETERAEQKKIEQTYENQYQETQDFEDAKKALQEAFAKDQEEQKELQEKYEKQYQGQYEAAPEVEKKNMQEPQAVKEEQKLKVQEKKKSKKTFWGGVGAFTSAPFKLFSGANELTGATSTIWQAIKGFAKDAYEEFNKLTGMGGFFDDFKKWYGRFWEPKK